jgi:hypothetical protein
MLSTPQSIGKPDIGLETTFSSIFYSKRTGQYDLTVQLTLTNFESYKITLKDVKAYFYLNGSLADVVPISIIETIELNPGEEETVDLSQEQLTFRTSDKLYSINNAIRNGNLYERIIIKCMITSEKYVGNYTIESEQPLGIKPQTNTVPENIFRGELNSSMPLRFKTSKLLSGVISTAKIPIMDATYSDNYIIVTVKVVQADALITNEEIYCFLNPNYTLDIYQPSADPMFPQGAKININGTCIRYLAPNGIIYQLIQPNKITLQTV